MAIIVNLDIMLAKRKMTSLELAQRIGTLEVLLLALLVGCTRSNLIKHNLRLSIITVYVVTICYKNRLYAERIVYCIVTLLKVMFQCS